MPFVPDAVSVLQNRPAAPTPHAHARTHAAALQVFVVRDQVHMQNHPCLYLWDAYRCLLTNVLLVCARRRHFLSV